MKSNLFRYVTIIPLTLMLYIWCLNAYGYKVGKTSAGKIIKWNTNSAYAYINTTGGPSDSHSAIVEAMRTWTNVSSSSFVFVPTQTSYSSTTFPKKDGTSLVDFGKLRSNACSLAIATVKAWYDNKTGIITECDMRFNTEYKFSTNGSNDSYDVQNIATHEFGHWLQLLDLKDKNTDYKKTMYGYGDIAETIKRDLEQDDMDGITYLYP